MLFILEHLQGESNLKGHFFLLTWIGWLLLGTMFYAYAPEMDLGLAKGFYMAVNIGYSIGFGYPTEPYIPYHWFSSFYVIMGASFVAAALGFFADKVGEDFGNWFEQQRQQQKYENAQAEGKTYAKKLWYWAIHNQEHLRAVGLWILWISMMITYSMIQVGWSFTEAQYFAISACSTGGHWAIPRDSPDWLFALTGVSAALGVPIMAVAMATIARSLISHGDLQETKEIICEPVTPEELKMLYKLGLENGDGIIDKSEFIILCMVRTGTDPALINFMAKRFDRLDVDGGGTLTIHELTEGRWEMAANGEYQRSTRNLMSHTTKSTSVDLDDCDSEIGNSKEKKRPVRGLART